MSTPPGVSFVIPVHNGEEWLERTLAAVFAQADGRPMEVIVVDDGSRDGSRPLLERCAGDGRIILIDGSHRGATAAINAGILRAKHPIICQVDQDVILHAGWMTRLTSALDDPRVGAAQGYYVAPPRGSLWSRVMGLDLQHRYRRISHREVDHVCTGNSAYRTEALRQIGLFDESLGYGYDNDVSYRLVDAGYRLVICDDARSTHEWRADVRGYWRQQYGFGYGRIDLVDKHRGRRVSGDDVSPSLMMLHGPLMTLALALLALAGLLALFGVAWKLFALAGAGIVGALALERFVAGVRASWRFRDSAGLLFAPVHLVRDLAWAQAIVTWTFRRLLGRTSRPAHSMHPREAKGA